MPLRCCCCAMMGRGRGEEEQQRAAASAPVAVPRCGRWLDGERPQAAAASGWRCRSCAAAAIAVCVALGCCPCAVVALVGLALVRAPLAVGRRLRRRRRSLLHRQRVRDFAASSSAGKATAAEARDGKGAKAAGAAPWASCGTTPLDPAANDATVAAAAPVHQQQQQMQDQAEKELAWVDEMYRVGHWGFGRVSFSGPAPSVKTP